MNLTLSVDEQIAAQARLVAKAMGKSLNQLVREYLEQLAGRATVEAARSASCEPLLTEDLQHDQIISGVRVVNPFV